MRRAETIITTAITLLKDKPTLKACELVKLFEQSGGYWLTKEEKQLIYSIVKCW